MNETYRPQNVPGNWRLEAQRYKLVAEKCPDCGQALFPPRPNHLGCPAKASAADPVSASASAEGTTFSSKPEVTTDKNPTAEAAIEPRP